MLMTTWVKRLLIANVAVFLLTMYSRELFVLLAFVPAYILVRPWTILTYMFVHAGFGHIFFNMLGLFFFGPRLESRLGPRDFLYLYFLSGLAGALPYFLLAPGTPMVGASAGVFGILLGYAMFWPDDRIYIWGVLPVPARVLVLGLAALSLYSGLGGIGQVAHFAHLGGFVGGWLFLRWRQRHIRGKRLDPRAPSTLERVSGRSRQEEERWNSIRVDGLHEVNRTEVERILHKIQAQGARSLTPDERAFMNRMSSVA